MKIVWSPRAIEHLIALRATIAQDSPQAAARIATDILKGTERLAQHPHIGRPGRVAGTRDLVIPDTPYIIPYRIRAGRLELIGIFHGRQAWPETL